MELVKGPTYSHEEMLAHMVAEYEVILLRTCYMYLHDKALAEDATQETFLKAYKALDSFRGESSEKTWLMRHEYLSRHETECLVSVHGSQCRG